MMAVATRFDVAERDARNRAADTAYDVRDRADDWFRSARKDGKKALKKHGKTARRYADDAGQYARDHAREGGALLAVALGGIWSWFFPHNQPGAYAVIGAAAFLATSMRMPVTSLVLIMEFTRINNDFFIPMALCIAGAVSTATVSMIQ